MIKTAFIHLSFFKPELKARNNKNSRVKQPLLLLDKIEEKTTEVNKLTQSLLN